MDNKSENEMKTLNVEKQNELKYDATAKQREIKIQNFFNFYMQRIYSYFKKNDNNKTNLSSYKKDLNSIVFLLFMNFLQGIPMGLVVAIPAIMISKKGSYSDLGTFSFVMWPFSLKLIWAPIIDSFYSEKIGRRRTWLLPIQFLIGILMISFAEISQTTLDKMETRSGIF